MIINPCKPPKRFAGEKEVIDVYYSGEGHIFKAFG